MSQRLTAEDVKETARLVAATGRRIVGGGRGGSIILISSAAGVKLQPFMIHHTACKHAVDQGSSQY